MDWKVITFNIHHGRGTDGKTDINRIAREIGSVKPDIVALQEVDRFHPRSFLHDQLRRLGRSLQMEGVFAPSINLGLIQYGNAVLTRCPILSKQVTYMQGVSERRSILTVKLGTEGNALTVVNTHLGVLQKERERQFPELLKCLSRIDGPAVLLGDFNMPAGHSLFTGLPPEWRRLAPARPMPTVVHGGEIDHIFFNRKVRRSEVWVKRTSASDHHAVVAEFSW